LKIYNFFKIIRDQIPTLIAKPFSHPAQCGDDAIVIVMNVVDGFGDLISTNIFR